MGDIKQYGSSTVKSQSNFDFNKLPFQQTPVEDLIHRICRRYNMKE